jgi:hypothetical protein
MAAWTDKVVDSIPEVRGGLKRYFEGITWEDMKKITEDDVVATVPSELRLAALALFRVDLEPRLQALSKSEEKGVDVEVESSRRRAPVEYAPPVKSVRFAASPSIRAQTIEQVAKSPPPAFAEQTQVLSLCDSHLGEQDMEHVCGSYCGEKEARISSLHR